MAVATSLWEEMRGTLRHNANIPVNGDAELIVALAVQERLGAVLAAGSIDSPKVKDLVSVIMEGSREAFRLRRERYGY